MNSQIFFSWSIVFLVSLFVTTLVFVELPVSLCTDLMIGTQGVEQYQYVQLRGDHRCGLSTLGSWPSWCLWQSSDLTCAKNITTIDSMNMKYRDFQKWLKRICSSNFVNSKLYSMLFHSVTLLRNLTIKIDVASFQIQTLSLKSQNRLLLLQEIIVYFRSTINACSLLSHEWWVPLIKFMVGPTIYVRGGSTYLWYSGST